MTLSGKTCLVAGASRGIGLAIAQAMARAGAATTLAARSLPALEKAAADLTAEGHQAYAMALDFTDAASIQAAAAQDYDILVNVAGTNTRQRFETYTPEQATHIWQTNLHGIVTLTQAIGSRMAARGSGKIVNIGSITSALGLPYLSIYAMTKSAIAGLTRTLAAEWGRHNVQVNCIAPGFIVTDLNREMWQSPVMQAWLRGAQANPRLGTPEDIAPVAVFLAGPGSDYVTGQTIHVDGGYATTAVWPFEPAS
ncbi:MAG: SDR family oxidoreductase [Bryobacteraceae bacterium]|nr:SDR family oxidoreductase [Bryobacteraceae bacterium]